jgi:hypothetical protein
MFFQKKKKKKIRDIKTLTKPILNPKNEDHQTSF